MCYPLPVSDFDPAAQGSKVKDLGVGYVEGWGSPPAVKEKRYPTLCTLYVNKEKTVLQVYFFLLRVTVM